MVMLDDEIDTVAPTSIASDDDVNMFETLCVHLEKLCLCVTTIESAQEAEVPDCGADVAKVGTSVSEARGKEIASYEWAPDEVSSYESDSDDGDWNNFALMGGDKKGVATEDPVRVYTEGGECSHKWPCTLTLPDSGEDAEMYEEEFVLKPRPCVLYNCAEEALTSVLENVDGGLRDAPPVLDENIDGGIHGALHDLDYEGQYSLGEFTEAKSSSN
uniref:Uncharacterized protein n=1 Tax=Noccaea caerulescens TaxID=107243 RepID=A0A1J3J9A1_NOCCA